MWRLQDSGPDARLPQWAEHLTVALPLGLLSSASLPARRGALRTLLEMLLAADQAPMRQVTPARHLLLQNACDLERVCYASIHSLLAHAHGSAKLPTLFSKESCEARW